MHSSVGSATKVRTVWRKASAMQAVEYKNVPSNELARGLVFFGITVEKSGFSNRVDVIGSHRVFRSMTFNPTAPQERMIINSPTPIALEVPRISTSVVGVSTSNVNAILTTRDACPFHSPVVWESSIF